MEIIGWLIVVAMVGAGFVGLVFPVLPGPLLVFCGLWLGAWMGNYQQVGVWTLALLLVLTLLSFVADWVGAVLGAKKVGASRAAIIGATLGTLVGFVFGPLGVVLGPFAGATAGELMSSEDWRRAGEVGFATTLGIVVAIVAKLGLCFLMVGIFLLKLFF